MTDVEVDVVTHFAHFMADFPSPVIFLLVVFLLEPVACVVHELGHAAVALARLPGRVVVHVGREPALAVVAMGRLELRLHPAIRPWRFDAYCDATRARMTRLDAILFALGGPMATLTAGILMLVMRNHVASGSAAHSVFTVLVFVGIGSALISLVPLTLTDSQGRKQRTDGGIVAAALRGRRAPTRPKRFFECFTEPARQAIVAGQEEARALRHNYIGTEHLLLALLRFQDVPAVTLLKSAGITPEAARAQVLAIAQLGQEPPTTAQLLFTPRAKIALELALRAALSHQRDYVGPEHIVAGLLDGQESISAQVLSCLGADSSEIRTRLEGHL